MDNLIKAVLEHYVPTIIIISVIVGAFAIALAGIIRNSGKHDDVARSNIIIKTVIVGVVMLFVSGAFVFAFHEVYVSKFYSQINQSITSKLPSTDDIKNTTVLGNDLSETQATSSDPKCVLVVVDTIDCIKKTINDVIGNIIGKLVRGIGEAISKVVEKFNFNFLFNLPAELFSNDNSLPQEKLDRISAFNSLIHLSEIIGLAFVYLLIVTHYFKSIIFSLDEDFSQDFIGDVGKMLLGFAGVFLARYMAEAVILTAQSFATFMFNTQLAAGLTAALKGLITDGLWSLFGGFGLSLVGLAIFVLVYIVLFALIVFRNAKRYFILLLMTLLAPIFTPMLFFSETANMAKIFWHKFFTTSFSLLFDLLILLIVFVFLSSGGFTLSNLILMLVGMAIVADSNNLLQQIANASEVAGFKSVIRRGVQSGAGLYYRLKRLKS